MGGWYGDLERYLAGPIATRISIEQPEPTLTMGTEIELLDMALGAICSPEIEAWV